jgi:uncharacterized membrane protein
MKRREFAAFIFALGLWMLASAFTFGEAGSRMYTSDIIAGVLLLVFALFSHFPHHVWYVWAVAVLGLWIQIAPLVLWTDQTAEYINGTLCGFFAMAIALRTITPQLVPLRDGLVPSGWSFNPSTWSFRIPLIFGSLLCSFLARYLAAFQLGLIPEIRDPVFGDGTYRVITSAVSHAFPVSDAGLGALAYLIEVLMGCEGDVQRWRTRPWAVLIFGILVIPVSIVSTILIILQPVVVGAWCFWCLLTAFLMVIMIPLALPEFVACIHFVHQNWKRKPLHKLLLHGHDSHGSKHANSSQKKILQGVSFPWNLIACALLGVWMVFSADFFNPPKLIADCDFIVGPLIFVVSVLSMAEITRAARFVNFLFAAILMFIPWFSTPSIGMLLNQIIVGVAIILLSIRRGPIYQRYGTLQRFIF